MLPAGHRLTSGESFRAAVRRGRRSGARTLVLHLHRSDSGDGSALVGFVVSRAVGPAVVRNRVKRRLRHLVRERLSALPGGSVLVVRAQPAARNSTSAELGDDLDRCLGRLLQEVG